MNDFNNRVTKNVNGSEEVKKDYCRNSPGIKESLLLINSKEKQIFKKKEPPCKGVYGIEENSNRIKVRNYEDVTYSIVTLRDMFHPNNAYLANVCENKKIIVFISPTINHFYGSKIKKYFKKYFSRDSFCLRQIKTSEQNKTLKNIETICLAAKKFKLDRRGLMIAVGGGITNDLVGFAASIYKRGIQYLQINTTLVGQIDVAVGIKTAVNFDGSKNFLGSFYPPLAAINDPTFLTTLPFKELKCGVAEILKMALVCDKRLFELLDQYGEMVLTNHFTSDDSATGEIVKRAMIGMVEELYPNLYEWNLERRVDFGHTFSPYIEVKSNYRIRHGEAVAIDMAISCRISYLLGNLTNNEYDRIIGLYLKLGLPFFDETTCNAKELWGSLEDIYLHRGMELNFINILAIGKAGFIKEKEEIGFSILQQAISDLRDLAQQYGTVNVLESYR